MNFLFLFGAQSYEHEISIVTAISLKDVIKKSRLNFVFVDKDRRFFLIESQNMQSKYFSSGDYKKSKELMIKHGGFSYKTLMGVKDIDFDVCLNLIHGADGEDGKISSLLEFFSISFIGPRTDACVLSFNKYVTKSYAKACSVNTLEYQLISYGETPTLKFPYILKPARLGSSIGINVVKKAEDLNYALDSAFEYDSEVLVEPFLDGVKEYNLAGCRVDGEFIFSIIEEPQKGEVLDFDKKYLDFARTERVLKANIDLSLENGLKEAFKKIYNNTFDGSLIRCDFFVSNGVIYLNEINPIPGSMANYLFNNFEDVIVKLANNLPKSKKININYQYIHSIQKAKGK